MNIAQRIIMFLGLIIVVSLIIVPYNIQKFDIHVPANKVADLVGSPEYEWYEFHNIFTPPKSILYLDVDNYNRYTILSKRDYIVQLTVILSEIVIILTLFFVFKTKKKTN
jgi:hypothetical protein